MRRTTSEAARSPCHQAIVDLIGNTSTAAGLTVQCVLDTGPYPTRIRYTDKHITALPVTRHGFHGKWNYTLTPI